jgi:hypothetical protein
MNQEFKTLNDLGKKYSITFDDEDLEFSDQILKIYNCSNPELLKDIDLNNIIILNWLGLYYDINGNEDLMKKYYQMGVEKDGIGCMICLAQYYQQNKNYEKTVEYYMMGVERGNSRAMMYLGDHYKKYEKNYEMMKKYYLMAIDKNDSDGIISIVKMALFYQFEGKNNELMKKYYKMAIESGSTDAMFNLGYWYNTTRWVKYMINGNITTVLGGNRGHESDVEQMKKYFKMGIENDSIECFNEIQYYYNKNNDYIEYYNFLKNIKSKKNKLNKIIQDELNNLKLQHTQLIYV